MSKTTIAGGDRVAARLTARGAAAGAHRAVQLAEDIAATAAALAPGRLGEALQTRATADGAEVMAPGHARFVEFGTRHQRAQPFLRPAFEAARTGQTAKGGEA